eukprot:1668603-Pleurochrysis_carterae.AAC.1
MQIHITLAVRRLVLFPSRSSLARCADPPLAARRLALSCLSPPYHHLAPWMRCLTFADPPAPRAISHRGASCAVRLSQSGVLQCKKTPLSAAFENALQRPCFSLHKAFYACSIHYREHQALYYIYKGSNQHAAVKLGAQY